MVKRIIAGSFIGAILAGAVLAGFYFNRIYITALFCVIMIIGTFETARAAKLKCAVLPVLYSVAFCVLFIWCAGDSRLDFLYRHLTALTLVSFIVIGALTVIFAGIKPEEFINYIFVLIYPALLISPILYLNEAGGNLNIFAVTLILFTSVFTDMLAYFFGMLFGKHKLTPVSPKKTVEGAVGGTAGGIIGAVCLYLMINVLNFLPVVFPASESLWFYLVIGVFCSFFTQIGDLTASLIKRRFGVKDFGKLLFSHGGVMDRFDGIIINGCFIAGVFLVLMNISAV